MFTYVFGLTSPDALTIAVRSCRRALPVCTVTTPLRDSYTPKLIAPTSSAAPPRLSPIFPQRLISALSHSLGWMRSRLNPVVTPADPAPSHDPGVDRVTARQSEDV